LYKLTKLESRGEGSIREAGNIRNISKAASQPRKQSKMKKKKKKKKHGLEVTI
jgi:hypothetical protein